MSAPVLGRGERRARAGLVVGSSLATLLVLAAGYEAAASVRYARWRASFDNEGWLVRLTVASRNPVLLWEYRPYGTAGGITTNRYGFRDVDYESPEKPRGTHRVAFLGDSVTLGMGVPDSETFVARVGAMAAASGRRVQTLNFGVDGYNALQIAEVLRARVMAFEPDQVVYVMCLNDFDFADSSGRKIAYFRRPRSFLEQEIDRRYRSLRGLDFHRYHFESRRSEVFLAIVAMRDLLQARKVGFLLAVVPVFPITRGPDDYFADYPLADVHGAIARFAAGSGIRAHDLLADFRRQPPPPERYVLDLWHLNLEGHRVVADALFADLFPSS
jgi:lysophospholipase L1-like esterase